MPNTKTIKKVRKWKFGKTVFPRGISEAIADFGSVYDKKQIKPRKKRTKAQELEDEYFRGYQVGLSEGRKQKEDQIRGVFDFMYKQDSMEND